MLLFKPPSVYLNPNNYHKLVEESHEFWVIIVYEGQINNSHNNVVADAWNDVADKYKNIIKFGVIDVLRHHSLLHYLPYKFMFYPNIFTLHYGHSELLENLDYFSAKTLAEFGKILSTDTKEIIIEDKNEQYGNYNVSIFK